jgi:hypothetical protein
MTGQHNLVNDWFTCPECDKRTYPTRKGAKAALRSHANAKVPSGNHLCVYRCPHSYGWHIGHRPRRLITWRPT